MTVRLRALLAPGVLAALGAAALFGAGTPLAKLLLGQVDPWLMAGLLSLGAGAGLTLTRRLLRSPPGHPARGDWPWLAAAILCGGVIGPVLLMYGLSAMTASAASLLLNAEGVLTALLAWFVFRENFDRRIAFGMLAIIAGALVLSWPTDTPSGGQAVALWPALAVQDTQVSGGLVAVADRARAMLDEHRGAGVISHTAKSSIVSYCCW